MLHILTGLIAAGRGEVLICGMPVALKRSRDHLGFVPDDLPLPAALTGREYLEFHGGMRGRDDPLAGRRLAELLAMTDALDEQVGALRGPRHPARHRMRSSTMVRMMRLPRVFMGITPVE